MFCSLLHCKFVYFVYLLIVPHPTVFITHLRIHGMFACMYVINSLIPAAGVRSTRQVPVFRSPVVRCLEWRKQGRLRYESLYNACTPMESITVSSLNCKLSVTYIMSIIS